MGWFSGRAPTWRVATVTFLVCAPGAAAATQDEPSTARETFVVESFKNSNGFRALDYLETGLPALVAERLGHLAPLKFVGCETLFGHAPALTPRWTVSGEFARRPDWKIAVTVRITGSGSASEAVEATRIGGKDGAAATAVEAALAAFRQALGDRAPIAKPAVTQQFGRDPYAFVLYGRGVATYLGLGGRHRSQEEAIKILGRSLVIDPKVPETRRFLGAIHLENGRPGHARAMWSVAVEARPDYLAALAGLAALDRNEGSAAARDRYARLVELDPADLDMRRAYGEVLAEAGQLAQAQAELNKVLEASPDDLRARRALALVLASRRAGPELVVDLEEVVRLQPDSVDARMDLGAAYLGVGRRSEAEAVYDEVLHRRVVDRCLGRDGSFNEPGQGRLSLIWQSFPYRILCNRPGWKALWEAPAFSGYRHSDLLLHNLLRSLVWLDSAARPGGILSLVRCHYPESDQYLCGQHLDRV